MPNDNLRQKNLSLMKYKTEYIEEIIDNMTLDEMIEFVNLDIDELELNLDIYELEYTIVEKMSILPEDELKKVGEKLFVPYDVFLIRE